MDLSFPFFEESLYKVEDLNKNIQHLFKGEANAKILVCYESAISIELEDFLAKIFKAVKVDLEKEVCQLNARGANLSWALIEAEYNFQKILCFGLAPSQIGLNLQLKAYQPQTWEGKECLVAHKLADIQQDPQKKRQLWTALQQMFL